MLYKQLLTRQLLYGLNHILLISQSTKYCDAISDVLTIPLGVLRGNVLEPTLFTVYTNDLLKTIQRETAVAYVDDAANIGTGKMPHSIINTAYIISTVCKWSVQNGLILNPIRSQALHVKPQKCKFIATISDLALGAPVVALN